MRVKAIWLILAPLLGASALNATTANATFLSADPIGTKDDPNLYLYVGLDPVNKTDPTGLAGCGTRTSQTSLGVRIALTTTECNAWQLKQNQGLRDIASARNALAAWRRDPNSEAGRNFARAMTNAFGEGALSDGNISKLNRSLNSLETFYRDPGTARGGRYDVYRASGWSGGGTILGGQVAFGTNYFTTAATAEYSRRSTVHEPLHLFGIGDRSAVDPGPGRVSGPYWDQWYARENPRGASNNADNWACLMVQSCGDF